MENITLGQKAQRRAQILTWLCAGRISPGEAAQLLGVSDRHLRRLRARFEHQGVATLVHGNTGKSPAHKIDEQTIKMILTLAGEGGPYDGFNVCHLQEILQQRHALSLGRSTLSRLLREQGILCKRHKGKTGRRHTQRERKSAEGMLVQIDGSLHNWLEERGPKLCLIGAIDDATGKVLHLRFHPSECQDAYLLLLQQMAQNYGLPMAVYHDRHTILRSPKQATIEEELAGRMPMSQVQRVLHELGIESIAALSPQAKGRVERLWGTLQDRLCKEMRLAAVVDQQTANAFLPEFMSRFNARFALPAADPETAFVPLPPDCDLGYYFAVREERVVKADQSLSFYGQRLVLQDTGSRAGQKVMVHRLPEPASPEPASPEPASPEPASPEPDLPEPDLPEPDLPESAGELLVFSGKNRIPFCVVPPQVKAPLLPLSRLPSLPKPTKQESVDGASPSVGQARRRGWLHGDRTKSLSS